MTTRRGFLAGILAAGFAPAAIGSGVLMPVRKIVVPPYEDVSVSLQRYTQLYYCDPSDPLGLRQAQEVDALGEMLNGVYVAFVHPENDLYAQLKAPAPAGRKPRYRGEIGRL